MPLLIFAHARIQHALRGHGSEPPGLSAPTDGRVPRRHVRGPAIGRDFDLDVLARATKTSEDSLLDILEAAPAAARGPGPGNGYDRYNFTQANFLEDTSVTWEDA